MKKIKEALAILVGCVIYALAIHASGIGCPIKWLTGVSCAGCGMSRAAFYAVQLDFGKATYYHPLIWLMPICVALFFCWEKIPSKRKREITWAIIFTFAAVYAARLLDPHNDVVKGELQMGVIVRVWKCLVQ